MGAPKQYQGHHCRSCWRVSVAIMNDRALYEEALRCVTAPLPFFGQNNPHTGANRFLYGVPCPSPEQQRAFLPKRRNDGLRYTHRAVRNALAGLMESLAPAGGGR